MPFPSIVTCLFSTYEWLLRVIFVPKFILEPVCTSSVKPLLVKYVSKLSLFTVISLFVFLVFFILDLIVFLVVSLTNFSLLVLVIVFASDFTVLVSETVLAILPTLVVSALIVLSDITELAVLLPVSAALIAVNPISKTMRVMTKITDF